ncbi:ARM repeat-containing protein [Athelia psychrophila]|uniref:ARM repeat-containing protein n=1 Tax=Athelia psychrophila TaxID=1759441 RepID=A0A166SP90_9AGAM|nr:ARM repeat-containing protein [Fibularhizoctonia sp. CBS 109695]
MSTLPVPWSIFGTSVLSAERAASNHTQKMLDARHSSHEHQQGSYEGSQIARQESHEQHHEPLRPPQSQDAIRPSFPSALATARITEDIDKVQYAEGIMGPEWDVNVNMEDSKSKYGRGFLLYGRDFLLQFMPFFKEKSDQLPPPDAIGFEPVDQLGISNFTKPGGSSSIGNFVTPSVTGKPSEESFTVGNRAVSVDSAEAPNTPSSRGEKQQQICMIGQPLESAAPLEESVKSGTAAVQGPNTPSIDRESPEWVECKVKALLAILTWQNFDSISDQIITWANKSETEKDCRTLIQVTGLVFKQAAADVEWSEMYARLCLKMVEKISASVQDDSIKNSKGEPVAGGKLFRKFLLARCKEDFEQSWAVKGITAAAATVKPAEDEAIKAANDENKDGEDQPYSEEYYAASKAKLQRQGLIKFIGELFKLRMLKERIMHSCMKKLLGKLENPEEEDIEDLCMLLQTMGAFLDTPQWRAHVDAYFSRVQDLSCNHNVSPNLQLVLQDVIELRERKWIARDSFTAPTGPGGRTSPATPAKVDVRKQFQGSSSSSTPILLTEGSSSPSPSILDQRVPIKDGWNAVGTVKQGSAVTFGPIDDDSPPILYSSANAPFVKSENVESFGFVPVGHVNGKLSISNVPSSNVSVTSAFASTPPLATPAKVDVRKLFQGSGSSSTPTPPAEIASSPAVRPCNVPPQQLQYPPLPVPGWPGHYYRQDPYMQQAYYPQQWYMPGTPIPQQQHMPPQFHPHPPPGSRGQPGMPMSPRNPQMPLQPSTPTQSPALTHQPPHSNNGSISIASPPSMPSTPASQSNSTLPGTNSANRLSAYANTFVPNPPRSSKISIKAADRSAVDLKAISSKRANPGLPPSSPSTSGFNRAANGHRTGKSQIIRMESEEARQKRVAEEEMKADRERAVKEAEEKAKKDAEENAQRDQQQQLGIISQLSEPAAPHQQSSHERQTVRQESHKTHERRLSLLRLRQAEDMIPPSLLSTLSILGTAGIIEDINKVQYPQGIMGPKWDLNANAKDSKFKYDRDFLLQFMSVCKEKPDRLPPLDTIGLKPVDQFSTSRGGSGRHRTTSMQMGPPGPRAGSIGLGIGNFAKPGGSFSMGNFATPGATGKSSEERFAASNRAVSVGYASAPAPFGRPSPMVSTSSQGSVGPLVTKSLTRIKQGEKHSDSNNAPRHHHQQVGIIDQPSEPAAPVKESAKIGTAAVLGAKPPPIDRESPEWVEHKVEALLAILPWQNFDSISDQIIMWVNKSEKENDGRTLIQVIRRVFEKGTNEPTWSKLYARLCRKMMENVCVSVPDGGCIKNNQEKPIAGGQLFRRYLLNRCQEDFERGWAAKGITKAVRIANDENKDGVDELYSEEYCAVSKTKCQRLGLIKFVCELFKMQMLSEQIMHHCVEKLLGKVPNPEEEEIESLCMLLQTIGALIDSTTPKARMRMDMFFSRMKALSCNHNVSLQAQLMLQHVIELRERKWVARNSFTAPTGPGRRAPPATPAKVDVRKLFNGSGSSSSTPSSGILRPHPKVGDLSNFGKINKAAPLTFGPARLEQGDGCQRPTHGSDPEDELRLDLQPGF